MISKTIGCRGTLFSDKPKWRILQVTAVNLGFAFGHQEGGDITIYYPTIATSSAKTTMRLMRPRIQFGKYRAQKILRIVVGLVLVGDSLHYQRIPFIKPAMTFWGGSPTSQHQDWMG